jgi:16S rRNA (guanine527-N7)-methyltransferase
MHNPERDRRHLLERGLRILGIEPAERTLDLLCLFIDELLLWNGKMNLVGTSDVRDIVVRHVLDSLSVYPFIKHVKEPILDIGAGAGFPSVPLAIVDESLTLRGVERRKKRAAFLNNAAVILRLSNFRVLECDVRELKDRYRVVLARGVGELLLLYGLVRKILEERAMIIAFKGKMSEIEKEVGRLKSKVRLDKDVNLHIQKVDVPYLDDEERNIVIIETNP